MVSPIALEEIKKIIEDKFPGLKSCKELEYIVGYDKRKSEYGVFVSGIYSLYIRK